MNARQYRSRVRWVHLGLSLVLGCYVYSPWGGNETFAAAVKIVVFPVIALTGAGLWQQAAVLRLLGGGAGRAPGVPAESEP